MADPVGAIRVALSVDSAAFEKGLNRARGRLDSWGSRIRANIATMAKWAAGVAAAGVAIGTVFVNNAMKAIDALAKTADRLGATTEGLARMRYAAEQTGVAAGTLDMALQRMTRRIAEASVGTGEAQGALKELGLSAQDLAQMRPEEAFHVIANAMQGVTSQSERVRLAFKLFDSEGVALVNTLDLGSEGLRAMGDEADALGLSLSRVDANKVEQAGDSINRVRRAIDGIANRITVHLAPYISGVADLIAEWSIETNGFRDVIDQTFPEVMRRFGQLADLIEINRRGTATFRAGVATFAYVAVEAFHMAARGVTTLIDGINSGVNAAIRGVNKLRELAGRDPFSEITPLGESDFMRTLEGYSKRARELMYETSEAAGDIFAPLPSSKIEAWLESVKETADATAETFAERMRKRQDLLDQFGNGDGEGGGGPGGMSQEQIDRERELLEQRLQMLQESMMSEKELELIRYEERLELLREALEAELLTKQEYRELEADLLQQHEDNLTKIEEDAARRRTAIAEKEQRELSRIQEMEQRKRLSGYQNFAQNTMALGQQVFEDNKVLALAQALLSARTAIVEAYEWGSSIGGPPMGAAAAAVAAAATAAQVAAVRSTSVGSRGGAAGAGSGGSMGGVEDPQAGGGQQQQQPIQRTVHLNIVGDVFDQKTVRNLAEQINEYAEDGFRLTVRA